MLVDHDQMAAKFLKNSSQPKSTHKEEVISPSKLKIYENLANWTENKVNIAKHYTVDSWFKNFWFNQDFQFNQDFTLSKMKG